MLKWVRAFALMPLTAAVAGLLSLTGCAGSLPSEQRLDAVLSTKVAESYSEYTQSEAASALTEDREVISTGGSVTNLQDALNAAMERNADIRRAALAISRADAERMNAVFGYLPQVSAVKNFNRVNQKVLRSDNAVFALGDAKYNTEDASIVATQPIFDLGRIYGIKISRTLVAASEVDYVSTVQQVMFTTFDTYVAALQADEKVSSLLARRRLLQSKARVERDRSSTGITSEAGFLAVSIELSNLGIELSQQQSNRTKLLSELTVLTGTHIGRVAGLSLPQALSTVNLSAEDAVKQALQNNPKILRRIIAVAETELKNRQAYAADFSPVVSAFSNLVYEDRQGSRFGGGSENEDLTVGVKISVPIFNANGTGYSNLTTRIDFQDAKEQYIAETRQISAEIKATFRRMGDLHTAATRAQSAYSAARRLVRTEQSLVAAGKSQEFLLSVVRSRALEAKERVRHYKLEYIRARGRFEFLSGINLGELAQ